MQRLPTDEDITSAFWDWVASQEFTPTVRRMHDHVLEISKYYAEFYNDPAIGDRTCLVLEKAIDKYDRHRKAENVMYQVGISSARYIVNPDLAKLN